MVTGGGVISTHTCMKGKIVGHVLQPGWEGLNVRVRKCVLIDQNEAARTEEEGGERHKEGVRVRELGLGGGITSYEFTLHFL